MRSTVDLVALPYVFSQSSLLTTDQFIRDARDRGVFVSVDQLDALHRARVLMPLLRVSRTTRRIRRAIRTGGPFAWQMAYWSPTEAEDIRAARVDGALHDPVNERILGPRQRENRIGNITYASSMYLYCRQQLIHLPEVARVLPVIKWSREGNRIRGHLHAHSRVHTQLMARATALRGIVVAHVALEAPYHNAVYGFTRWRNAESIQDFETWRHERAITETLDWLGVSREWLTESATDLLRTADRIDPLARWHELVGHIKSERWEELRGDARLAVDLRTAAEVLLHYDEDLDRDGREQVPKQARPRERRPLDRRLRRTRSVDQVLTDFGLSPHPRLVLVVEGDSELLLAPRVLPLLYSDVNEDVISIQNAAGVDADIGILMSFLAPRTILDDTDQDRRFLDLTRPITQIYVVLDPEGRATTKEGREKRRRGWIDRILRTLPKEHRGEVRDQIDPLVRVTTWNERGASFEFAHWTDRELARAVLSIPGHRTQVSLSAMARHVTMLRQIRGNLEDLLPPRGSKVDLAEKLWPALERKIERAIERQTEARIPIVRILDEAVNLAYKYPRSGLVIGLPPKEHSNKSPLTHGDRTRPLLTAVP